MSLDLEAIKARADKATEGPWYRVGPPWNASGAPWINAGSPDPHHMRFICDLDADMAGVDHDDRGDEGSADAEFIAHAREDVPALLAEVERLRQELAANEGSEDARLAIALAALADIHRMARVFDTPRDVGRVVAFVGDVRRVAERAGGAS